MYITPSSSVVYIYIVYSVYIVYSFSHDAHHDASVPSASEQRKGGGGWREAVHKLAFGPERQRRLW